MGRIHQELHDSLVRAVEHINSQLVLSISEVEYSKSAPALVDIKRSRLVFTGVSNLAARKISGYTFFTRKPKFYQTARDLLELQRRFPILGLPIYSITRIEDGFVLESQATGEYFIMASGSYLDDWEDVAPDGNS